ncbi:MAG: nuclear transport factor 2 family protein [Rubricoccaceae bacterium]|nr:nuclear transport factor 2 family protein [Rubricoccaceae bacterium]
MSNSTSAEHLAHLWIEGWINGDPDSIPLAEDFVHTSPFGRLEGREHYLETVKPMAAENVARLTIIKTLSEGNEAVIRFDMETPEEVIPCCDWVRVEGEKIAEIHSFYDATTLRGGPTYPTDE